MKIIYTVLFIPIAINGTHADLYDAMILWYDVLSDLIGMIWYDIWNIVDNRW